MKSLLRTLLLSILLLASCAKSLKDIKMTSFDIEALTPRGLSAIDAAVSIGIDNPTVQVTLSRMQATAKMDGIPCMYVVADDVTLEPRTQQIYRLDLHGMLDENFNPFQLLALFHQQQMELITVDVTFRGTLRNGLSKDFTYNDIPLKVLLENI